MTLLCSLSQLAGTRDVVPVTRKPTIANVNQLVESGKAKHKIKRPRPPDQPGDLQIDICSGSSLAITHQQAKVMDKLIQGKLKACNDPGFLQGRDCESVLC